jgi:ATP-binding cassette subfamily C protein
VIRKLTERKEWTFFSVLPRADLLLASGWWTVLILRGVLPAVFAIATGVLVGAAQRGDSLTGALGFVGGVFVLLQILTPIHQAPSANLGDRPRGCTTGSPRRASGRRGWGISRIRR